MTTDAMTDSPSPSDLDSAERPSFVSSAAAASPRSGGASDSSPDAPPPPPKRARKRNTAPPSGPEPEAPFAGGPPRSGAGGPPPIDLPSTIQTILADPDGLGNLALVALDGAAVAVGRWRYGNDDAIKASAEGKKEIKKALIAMLAAANVQLTPSQALIAAVLAAYAPPIFYAEMTRGKQTPE